MALYAPRRLSAMLPMLATNFCDPIRNFLPDSDVPRPLSRPEDLKLIKDNYFHLRDNYKPPKHPIVLCHGLAGFDSLILMQLPNFKANAQLGLDEPQQNISKMPSEITDSVKASSLALNYWYGIEEALVKAGIDVITAKVPPFESIAARAHLLDTLLSEKCKEFSGRRPGERVKLNLVGHSMGGLDARYLISKIQTSQSPYEVVSLTTVGTPHHGSEVADFVMEILEQSVFLSMICPAAITQLTTSYLAKFNTEIRNDPRVGYFSFGALMDPSRIKRFRVTYEIIKRTIEESGEQFPQNDGMVSVSLARWGNYLGTLDNFDHLDLINWTNPLKVPFSEQETFNSIALYLDIADILSQNGY